MTTTDIDKTEPEGTGDDAGTDIVPAEGGGRGFTPAPTALLEPDEDPKAEALRTRLLLPLLLPVISALAIAFYASNRSRALLAGGSTGGLIVISVLTLIVLGGAAWISSQPELSTGALAVTLVVLLGIVGAAGLTTIGHAEPEGGGEAAPGYEPPKGPVVASFEVDALPTLKFQATDFPTTAGINEITYVGKGGTHTLVFDEPEFRGFELAVNGEEIDSGKIEFQPGVYTMYCSVPGHRAAGMEATVTVGDAISQ